MKGMRLVIGIIVSACVGKTMGTIPMLMNVEGIKGRNVGGAFLFILFYNRAEY